MRIEEEEEEGAFTLSPLAIIEIVIHNLTLGRPPDTKTFGSAATAPDARLCAVLAPHCHGTRSSQPGARERCGSTARERCSLLYGPPACPELLTVPHAPRLAGLCLTFHTGLARQPPMGWRSWYFNIFDMDESVWNATVDALVDTSRLVCVVPCPRLLLAGSLTAGRTMTAGWPRAGWMA